MFTLCLHQVSHACLQRFMGYSHQTNGRANFLTAANSFLQIFSGRIATRRLRA
jgi:hypothetical protein